MSGSVTATCVHCGNVETWDHDKSLDVPCPTCKAAIGHPCKRPSGHEAARLHSTRTKLAFETGAEPACPCRTWQAIEAAS